MKRVRFLFAIALFALPGAVQAQQIKVHYDHGIDFTRFKTYSWLEGEPSNNPVAHQQIVLAIDRQLLSKGLKRVEENGDLNVAYYASLGGNVNARMVEYMQGLDLSRWEGGVGETVKPTVGAMPMARVVLDLVDASAKKLVWRGTARDAFTPNQAHAQKRITSDIAKLLKNFPPHPSKAGAQKTR